MLTADKIVLTLKDNKSYFEQGPKNNLTCYNLFNKHDIGHCLDILGNHLGLIELGMNDTRMLYTEKSYTAAFNNLNEKRMLLC